MEEEDYYVSGESDDDAFDCRWAPSKPHVTVITKDSLLSAQMKDLQGVMDLLSIGEHHARTLLIHYRWDVDKLIAVYVDKGKSCMFAAAGITVVESVDHGPRELESNLICNICMDDVPASKATSMDCGHLFCNDCWAEHFIVKINDGQSKQIRCMAVKCYTICDEAIVRKLVSLRRPELAENYERYLSESYINDNNKVKWCPSVPHCGNAVRVEHDEFCEVECSCGLQFCYSCSSEAHSPCPCLMWDMWTKKSRDESENVNWITQHAKPCPKCRKPVEKNGGCNLVFCLCGQPFCWLCGGATGHQHTITRIYNHTCGQDNNKHKGTEHAKSYLNIYMHYYNRYKVHADSSNKESVLREPMQEKISQLGGRFLKMGDFSWLTDGLNGLLRSRRTLMYSYPFAFYMFGEVLFPDEMTDKDRQIKQNLFEDQQQQLESNVERLSKFLEELSDDYSEEQVMELRNQIVTLSAITDNLCRKMYECIENDLLGSFKFSTHIIAPYRSQGIEKAEELTYG